METNSLKGCTSDGTILPILDYPHGGTIALTLHTEHAEVVDLSLEDMCTEDPLLISMENTCLLTGVSEKFGL